MKKSLLAIAICLSLAAPNTHAQLKLPALSPSIKMVQDFSVSSIELSYSRPSMRNRKIFGDLVPYGMVWRTGANSATKIKFGEDVTFNGIKVKAGEYALYSIPNKDTWEVILNTGTGNWGSDGYSKENDVLHVKVKPSKNEAIYQTFAINIVDLTYTSCKLEIVWEKTKLLIPIVADNEINIEKNIDKAINHPSIPYFQVANYYNENNKNLDKALTYVNKALEADPSAYYMWHLKAKLEKKLGHYEQAIAAAKKSIEAAKDGSSAEEYRRNNEKIIDEINKSNKLNPSKKDY